MLAFVFVDYLILVITIRKNTDTFLKKFSYTQEDLITFST